ncbi:chorion peroxidase, partial [Eurytemora carolleeae]|uniref:chorion peroxidase n=1 Tax=Eurytemora carolleeae TaxID=1294199 RepID=UPI000C774916
MIGRNAYARIHSGGRLVENTERAGHLPTKQQLSRISDHLDDRFDFVAGDNRVNEQPFLTSMHTLFLREHNRLAGILERELNTANDELIYQSARKLVIIELQNIIYKEFLPLLLGRRTADKYKLTIEPETTVYNPAANPSVLNEFATAAMRYGHSMINSLFKVIIKIRIKIRIRSRSGSRFIVFIWQKRTSKTRKIKKKNNVGKLKIVLCCLGLLNQNAQKVDGSFADELTNHLFQEHSPKKQTKFGGDLVARNLQRGRDHGLADYNTYRKICNLQPLTSFQQIPAEIKPEIWQRFQSLYKNIIIYL